MNAALQFLGQTDGYAPTPKRQGDSAAVPRAEMRFAVDGPQLSGSAFTLLRDLIHERTGIFYDEGRRDLLSDKLASRLAERRLDSFLDYYYLLRYDAAAAVEEWRRVADVLGVPETYFWREMDPVRTLVEVIAPAHFARPGGQPLRIWSAACCTGEEPLTIAMALQESGAFARGAITLRASDASAVSVEKARRGLYRGRAFRALAEPLQAKYFRPEGDAHRIAPDLHSRVDWSVANLLAPDEIAPLARVDVIFCRNVFIYFSPESIRRVLRVFHEQLSSPGYLFVGASESLLKVTDDFQLEEIGGAFVYVKK